jgi:hypothetical protein
VPYLFEASGQGLYIRVNFSLFFPIRDPLLNFLKLFVADVLPFSTTF